jgi:ADP-ribose pyrophosphatase YjhB (NUDIX family)
MDKYSFQNCQKLVVFSADNKEVLLAKRKGENDYDGVFSFIGGKMEITDQTLIVGMRREKGEEIGTNCKIKIYPLYSTNNYFIKKDGNHMILPHYYAQFVEGEIKLNSEYSEYRWVPVDELDKFEPKIPNIPEYAKRLLELLPLMNPEDMVEV